MFNYKLFIKHVGNLLTKHRYLCIIVITRTAKKESYVCGKIISIGA